MTGELIIITGEQVRSVLSMKDAVGLMRKAFVAISGKGATVPLRTAIDIPERGARTLFMPVYVPSLGCTGIKVVSVYPDNSSVRGIPNIHGKILLLDARDGVPLCLIDAEYLTALRTGAASGVATDRLALPDAKALAIVGTGAQALMQVQGVCTVRRIENIFVYGREARASREFATVLREDFGLNARAGSPADWMEADIICTATNSATPVLDASFVKKGCHINAIGSFKPDMQELPEELIVRAELFVDQLDAALSEPGDVVIPLSRGVIDATHIKGELGDVLEGRVGGRSGSDAVTVFKSVGNAVQDIYAAKYVYDKIIGSAATTI